MLVERRWLIFYVGRDHARQLPASVGLALFPDRGNAKPGKMIPAKARLAASWQWLPRLFWKWDACAIEGAVCSAWWTGRPRTLAGFSWPFVFDLSFGGRRLSWGSAAWVRR